MIRQSWERWRKIPFPEGVAGTEIDGVCLASLDTYSAGCIETYLDQGALDPERERILRECVDDLQRIVPKLPGVTAEYFSELARIGQAVVEECAVAKE